MNDTEVTKTIQQMVRFIKQEAEEKSSEIMVAAEEEFNITKLQLLEAEKAKVRREYERREGTIEVKKKVEYSKQLNASRLKILQAQEDAVQSILSEAHAKLVALSSDKAAYSKLLQALLEEAVGKLGDSKVLVRCRKVDLDTVRGLIPQAAAACAQRRGGKSVDIQLDEAHPLPPPPSGNKSEEFETCTGGVVVTSADGRIVCSNTLDDRLKIAYGANLPSVREILFGAAPAAAS